MQDSAVALPLLAAALGFEPPGPNGLHSAAEPGSGGPFAALLAAAQEMESGETLPGTGNILPAGADLSELNVSNGPQARAGMAPRTAGEPSADLDPPGDWRSAAIRLTAAAERSVVSAETEGRTVSPPEATLDRAVDFGPEPRRGDRWIAAYREGGVDGPTREAAGLPHAAAAAPRPAAVEAATAAPSAAVAEAAGAPPAPGAAIASVAPSWAPPAEVAVASPAARAAADAPNDTRRSAAEAGDAMAGRIRMLVEQGTGEARLRLHPAELGSIDVRVSVIDDQAFVHLAASHAAARDVLEQSLPRLRELLAEGGLGLGGASVESGEPGADSPPGFAGGDASYHLMNDGGDDSAASSADVRTIRAAGRIDVFA